MRNIHRRYDQLNSKTHYSFNEAMEYIVRITLFSMGYKTESSEGHVLIDENNRFNFVEGCGIDTKNKCQCWVNGDGEDEATDLVLSAVKDYIKLRFGISGQ